MLISWQLRPFYSYSTDTGGLNDLIDCNLAYALFASLCLLLLCIGAFMGLFSLVVIARRFPKLRISTYFKPNPVDYMPRAPCNSPTLPRARRRMKPLRPLPASEHSRPIARVPAFSNLREGVVYKNPRQHQRSGSRAVTFAEVHHAGPARGSTAPRGPLASTYV